MKLWRKWGNTTKNKVEGYITLCLAKMYVAGRKLVADPTKYVYS